MPDIHARKPQDIAAVVRAAREGRGLSQAELAEQLAFSRDYMVSLESGQPTVHMKRLFRTLHELGITVTLSYGEPDGRP